MAWVGEERRRDEGWAVLGPGTLGGAVRLPTSSCRPVPGWNSVPLVANLVMSAVLVVLIYALDDHAKGKLIFT